MRKKISIDDLIIGMQLDGMETSWLNTPFITHHFKIKNEEQIRKIKDAGVLYVYIDTRKSEIPTENITVKNLEMVNFLEKDEVLEEGSENVRMEEALFFKKKGVKEQKEELYTEEDLQNYYKSINNYIHISKEALLKGSYIDFPLYTKKDLKIQYLLRRKDKANVLVSKETLKSSEDILIHTSDKDKYKIYLNDLKYFDKGSDAKTAQFINNVAIREKLSIIIKELFDNPRNIKKLHESISYIEDIITTINDSKGTIAGLFTMQKKDYYNYTHTINVTVFSLTMAVKTEMFKMDELRDFGIGCVLHDIGKCRIPVKITNKPTRLTDEEFTIMKQHPILGQKILSQYKDIPHLSIYPVIQHHEKLSGSGYPFGLKEDELHLLGKICSIADAYDSLTTGRPFKNSFSSFEALSLLKQQISDYDANNFIHLIKVLASVEK
ncbi:phosphodiesterase [Candidatus Magnetoovum chiemensis]|nr:phosphodiesterase [Candidatus Magnetoovum chiemensis]